MAGYLLQPSSRVYTSRCLHIIHQLQLVFVSSQMENMQVLSVATPYFTNRYPSLMHETGIPNMRNNPQYTRSISPSETNSFRSTIHGIGADMGRVALGLGLAVFRGIEIIDISFKVAALKRQLTISDGELRVRDKPGFLSLIALLSYVR